VGLAIPARRARETACPTNVYRELARQPFSPQKCRNSDAGEASHWQAEAAAEAAARPSTGSYFESIVDLR